MASYQQELRQVSESNYSGADTVFNKKPKGVAGGSGRVTSYRDSTDTLNASACADMSSLPASHRSLHEQAP
jgi:hypothetical protein